MEITEVRIKLMDDPHDRLQAFCSITFDGCFVIRDLKIIQGAKGSFVAMPSRKLTDRCPRCLGEKPSAAQFCNQCGAKLDEERATKDNDGRAKLYADIAHPINSDCRELIQSRVLEEYERELVRSKEPGYVCTYDDYGEDRYATLKEDLDQPLHPPTRTISDGTVQHRIEPAASGTGGPHHQTPAPHTTAAKAVERQEPRIADGDSTELAEANHHRRRGRDDDDFGAGL